MAFTVFESCQTQWRVIAGMNGVAYLGLEYPSVLAVMSAMAIKKKKRVFRQIQLIEVGALSVINDG